MKLLFIIITSLLLVSNSLQNTLCNALNVSKSIVPEIEMFLPFMPLDQLRTTVVGDQVRWWKLLHRMDSIEAGVAEGDQKILVSIFGGSMTLGSDCIEGDKKGPDCCYSHRFVTWLREVYPHVDIIESNMARGGRTTEGLLPELPLLLMNEATPDIVILDFSVNDALRYDRVCKGEECFQYYPAILAATEHFLEELLVRMPSSSVVLLVEAEPRPISVRSRLSHIVAAKNYNVSMVDYHKIVRDNIQIYANGLESHLNKTLTADEAVTVLLWSKESHPNWIIHHLLAHVLAYSWQLERSEACKAMHAVHESGNDHAVHTVLNSWNPYHLGHMPAHVSTEVDWNKNSFCDHPVSFYSSQLHYNLSSYYHGDSGDSGVRVTKGNWTLYEDREGKPGWISTGPKGSTIEFDIKFGRIHRLLVGFTRSYEGFGSAKVTVPETKKWAVLNGLDTTNRYSQTYMQEISDISRLSFKNLAVSITLTCDNCKFKLEYVVSC